MQKLVTSRVIKNSSLLGDEDGEQANWKQDVYSSDKMGEITIYNNHPCDKMFHVLN